MSDIRQDFSCASFREAVMPVGHHSFLQNPPRYDFHSYVEMVDPKEIKPYMEFPDRKPSKDLIESIKKHGIRTPLLMYYDQQSHKALLVEGNHRMVVALRLGLKEVPLTIRRINETGRSSLDNVDKKGSMVPRPYKPNKHNYVPGDLKPSEVGFKTHGKAIAPVIKESPDETFGPGKKKLKHYAGDAIAFGFIGNALIWDKDRYGNHPELAEMMMTIKQEMEYYPNKSLDQIIHDRASVESVGHSGLTPKHVTQVAFRIRTKLKSDFSRVFAIRKQIFDYPGRYWHKNQIVSFWAKRDEVPNHIIRNLVKNMRPLIQTERIRFEFADSRPGYDNMLTYQDIFNPKPDKMFDLEKEKLRSLLQRLHTVPDSKLSPEERALKKKRAQGFGSQKKSSSGLSATQMRQKFSTSESSSNE